MAVTARSPLHARNPASSRAPAARHRLLFWMALAGVLAVVAAGYRPVLRAQARFLDDDAYLTHNRLVRDPSWSSAARFLREVLEPSTVEGYYQPLTMISLMADYRLGGRPEDLRAFHRTNLLLHLANTALLALLVRQLLQRSGPALAVALLFGLHPLTVESVAWLAERKTLLATCCVLAALNLHVRHARRGGWRIWAAALLAYVLALLAKPISTPLPLLMLVLDAWPLRRFGRRAVIEKLPHLAIGAMAAAITIISQARTITTPAAPAMDWLQAGLLLGHNLVFYLGRWLWPADVYWFYARPAELWPAPGVVAGVIGTPLLAICAAVSLRWTRAIAACLLFYFIALLPSLWLVGTAGVDVLAANRYAYLPLVGLMLLAAWLLGRAWDAGRMARARRLARAAILGALALAAILEFTIVRRALHEWRDSYTLYAALVQREPNAPVLHNGLADALADRGDLEPAVAQYRQALALRPDYAEAHANLAVAYMTRGTPGAAIAHAAAAARLKPKSPKSWYNWGTALLMCDQPAEAAPRLRKAAQMDPEFARAHANLGVALLQTGAAAEAVDSLRRAAALSPGYVDAWFNLGFALERAGRPAEAQAAFEAVLRLDPQHVEARAEPARLTANRQDGD